VRKLLIKFVLSYFRFFAKSALRKNKPTIIGIAGSVGKSSLRNAVSAILKQSNALSLAGNSETGIPLSILGLQHGDYSAFSWLKNLLKAPFRTNNLKGIEYLIAEMGIDDPYPPKNMDYLLTILKPDIAVSLNVSATHTMQFEKAIPTGQKKTLDRLIDAIAYEDTKIITKSNCKIGIYNNDNKYIKKYLDKFRKEGGTKLLTFGKEKENSIRLSDYEVSIKKTKFTFTLNEKTKRELTVVFKDSALPKAYADTFAAAILVARSLKIPIKSIDENLESNYTVPAGRASVFNGIRKSTIIDSTYNASKESMLAFLDLLKELKRTTKRPVVFVFGDMRELGVAAKEEHEEVARYAKEIVNSVYCVGPQTKEFAYPILKDTNRRMYKDSSKNSIQLGLHLKESLLDNAIILFKGSQNEIFLEEAIKFILENPQDEKRLCRQSEYWKNTKAAFFNRSVVS